MKHFRLIFKIYCYNILEYILLPYIKSYIIKFKYVTKEENKPRIVKIKNKIEVIIYLS